MSWPRTTSPSAPTGDTWPPPPPATARSWPSSTWRRAASCQPRRHVEPINAVAFSPDGHRLASAVFFDDVALDVTIWDPASAEVRTIPQVAATEIRSLAFSPDGRTLAVGGWRLSSGFVDLFDLESGKMTRSWNEGSGFHSLAFSPDGSQVTGGDFSRGAVLVWDVATGKMPHLRRYPISQLRGLQPGRPPAGGDGLFRRGASLGCRIGQEMLILRPFAPPPGTLGFTPGWLSPRMAPGSPPTRPTGSSPSGTRGADAVPAFRDLQSQPAIESPDPALLKKRADLAMRSGRWDAAVADSSRLLARHPDHLRRPDHPRSQPRAGQPGTGRERRGSGAPAHPGGSSIPRPVRGDPRPPGPSSDGTGASGGGSQVIGPLRSTYETLLRLGPDRAGDGRTACRRPPARPGPGGSLEIPEHGPRTRSRVRHRSSFVLNRPMSAAGEITLVYPKLPGWTRLAAAFALRGEWSAARDVLGKAEADPSGASGEDRFLLAWVDHRLGRDEEARRSLDQAIGWMEEHESVGELGALARVIMPEVLGTSPADAARRITRAAGEWPIARLSPAIDRQPNNLNWRYQRGECLADRGDWSRAAGDFAVAVEQVPDNAMFHYQLALARLLSGDRAGYRAACGAAFDRFGATADPRVANRVLFACVFRPDAVHDLAALDRLALCAGATYPGGERIVGAALCCAGRYEEALNQFDLAQRVLPPRAFELAFTGDVPRSPEPRPDRPPVPRTSQPLDRRGRSGSDRLRM